MDKKKQQQIKGYKIRAIVCFLGAAILGIIIALDPHGPDVLTRVLAACLLAIMGGGMVFFCLMVKNAPV